MKGVPSMQYKPFLLDLMLAVLAKKAAEGDSYSRHWLYQYLKLPEGTCTCGK